MFQLATQKKIGQYLKVRIKERFGKQCTFVREYLKANRRSTDKDSVQNMKNRLTQILNGNKEIQFYDLPVFCLLLDLSCEDILSAGKSHAASSGHLTNYVVAFSKDKHEWETYIARKDSPILNADEYGKTVIDYALEAENYDLLKYLMDKKYIWFVDEDKKDFFVNFGAGTNIERATFPHPDSWNVLDARLKMRDELRTNLIALAVQHGDIDMLRKLRAREIPTLYQINYSTLLPDETYETYRNETLMEALIHADNKILEFFSSEFEITYRDAFPNKFTFPFLGELLSKLIQNGNAFAKYMLQDAIRHNQSIYDQLTSLFADAVEYFKQLEYYDMTDAYIQNDLQKQILHGLDFYVNGSLVSYFTLYSKPYTGLRSNIIRVNAKSEDPLIQRQIAELNGLYKKIHTITPKFEGGNHHDF